MAQRASCPSCGAFDPRPGKNDPNRNAAFTQGDPNTVVESKHTATATVVTVTEVQQAELIVYPCTECGYLVTVDVWPEGGCRDCERLPAGRSCLVHELQRLRTIETDARRAERVSVQRSKWGGACIDCKHVNYMPDGQLVCDVAERPLGYKPRPDWCCMPRSRSTNREDS